MSDVWNKYFSEKNGDVFTPLPENDLDAFLSRYSRHRRIVALRKAAVLLPLLLMALALPLFDDSHVSSEVCRKEALVIPHSVPQPTLNFIPVAEPLPFCEMRSDRTPSAPSDIPPTEAQESGQEPASQSLECGSQPGTRENADNDTFVFKSGPSVPGKNLSASRSTKYKSNLRINGTIPVFPGNTGLTMMSSCDATGDSGTRSLVKIHVLSMRASLSLRQPLNEYLALGYGLSYTVISGSDSYTFVGRYLGIPLSLNLIGTNRNALSYYASAGIRMDKCIGGEYGLTEVSEKGLQYTLTGGVGLDIPVTDKLSLTFEPQVGYRLTDISIPGASYAGRLELSANIGLCFRVGK